MFGKKFLQKHELTIINNAIDINKYKYNKNTRIKIRDELKINDKFVIGHIGRFCFQKNHDFLVDVFNEVQKIEKEAVLLLIGEGELEKNIKEKVRKLGIEDKVIFLGTTDNVQDYLQAMDVFVLPSRFEGLPVVGVEAQVSSTKCFFSNNITSEVKITKNVEFISLNCSSKQWAKKILENKNIDKCDLERSQLIYSYDIHVMSKKLTDIYSKMARINIMHTVYGLGSGGVETLLYNYFSETEEYNLSIVTQEISNEKVEDKFKNIWFKIYKTPTKRNIIKYIWDMIKIIDNETPDIIHSHMTMGNFLPNAIAFFKGVKIRISHSHFAYAEKSIKNYMYSVLGKIFSNEYMACTKDAARYLFGKDADKAYILKNAINLNKFKFDETKRIKIREQLNIQNKYVIGNVGRFIEQKNQMFLIDVFYEIHKNNENTILLLIGTGELENKIRDKIKKLKLEKDTIILSNRDDIDELMMAMDIFLFPSLFEGLGIVLIEAQATGLRCISSNNVPKDVILTDKIKILKLDEQEKWIKESIKAENFDNNRIIDFSSFEKNGYNIKIEKEKLHNYYENRMRRRNIEI